MERLIPDEAAMEALGHEIASGLAGGEILALVGGLGAGKTRFAKGLVAGLGHAGEVTSPTFALVHEYREGRLPVFHLDFYRLQAAEELVGIGWDEMLAEGGVVVAEWADRFPELVPAEARVLEFKVVDGGRVVRERG
ncbi:tRNA (adenosine(37)-N6)-threonylcarbamoyltransferase complex ATPase subunit type 1 TsaE [Haloferula sp. A504]|uniref:tRNA (adenosine(37)-N6)-threonylcarbamoyltransferase complex ATPase subunit type 1 TsaE n=1 Tax=Haloferula sp. A504 TaxID=3373601 RepID=UPI0031C190AE|nr:tRNA (adenosine(37)-N6)-threonylcarbamoyltransferase complex ATPase subunit type 1 TsaE [Verrucomicrobiaceae bacterium E54]